MRDVTSFLNDLAARVGTDTHLGAWLATPDAAPVVLGLAGFLFLLLLVVVLRRLLRGQAPLPEAVADVVADDPDAPARLHPEALSQLYDRVERREPAVDRVPMAPVQVASVRVEPVLDDPAATAAAAPNQAAGLTTVTGPLVPEPAIAPAVQARPAASAPVVSESFKLLVPAVDRLLRRVESQQAQIGALLEELKVQSSAVILQGERIIALEASLARVQQQESAPFPPVVVAAPLPETVDGMAPLTTPAMITEAETSALDQAIALAESGADEAELSARFGLSVAEARLVRLVHGPAPDESGAVVASGVSGER